MIGKQNILTPKQALVNLTTNEFNSRTIDEFGAFMFSKDVVERLVSNIPEHENIQNGFKIISDNNKMNLKFTKIIPSLFQKNNPFIFDSNLPFELLNIQTNS